MRVCQHLGCVEENVVEHELTMIEVGNMRAVLHVERRAPVGSVCGGVLCCSLW